MYNYSSLTLDQLIEKISTSRFFHLPKMVAEALRKITGAIFTDAPIDGEQYGRQDGEWTVVESSGGGDFIPLTGTTEGNPVTGTLEIDSSTGAVINYNIGSDNLISIYQEDGEKGVVDIKKSFNSENIIIQANNITSLNASSIGFSIVTDGDATILDMPQVGARGFTANQDFTATITDLDYVQKKYVDAQKPYKVYTALLTQTGTNAPTFTILENTLGITLTPSYTGTGSYQITTNVALPLATTTIDVGVIKHTGAIGATKYLATIIHANTNAFSIQSSQAPASTWNLANDSLVNNRFEIRVYS
jgi:hypothetical protein